MWSTPAVLKQYNKMAVLHFFLVNSSLYILFSMVMIPWKKFKEILLRKHWEKNKQEILRISVKLLKGLIKEELNFFCDLFWKILMSILSQRAFQECNNAMF